jgi:serine/threonine protein kinase
MRPGPHSDPSTALSLIRSGKVTAPSTQNRHISSELDGIVVKALQPKKKHRFNSAEEMRSALARVLANLNPSFDAGGVAGFMRELYGQQVQEAKQERERLINQDYSHLKRPTGPQKVLSLADNLEASADLTGRIIDGRYKIIRLLGEGGMGAVYEVEHMEIGRRMALKVLHAPYSNIPETMARFRQEARAASRIGHPNIVEVTDSGATEYGRLYFVMELLSGVDLAQVMAESHIVPARRALRITLQICRGLHAAHEAGVVHRDLKPENIFLIEREGRGDFVKILDFGIAKNIELAKPGDPRLTHPGMAMGTPEYMAPEQATGDHIDRRIDVYATGAMLYEMLTGHLPHEGETLMKVLSKKASEPPVPPQQYRPFMPNDLQEIILHSLASDPEKRYATMEQLADALLPYTLAGATDWSERIRTQSADAFAATAPAPAMGDDLMIAADTIVESQAPPTDKTAPAKGGADAHLVQPGEVRLGDSIVHLERRRVPVTDREDRGTDPTQLALPREPKNLILLLVAAASVMLLMIGLSMWIWWPAPQALAPTEPDAMVVDLLVVQAPDVAPKPDMEPPRPKLTPKEVDRLVEWARSAIKGRRYLRPKGDNARELIERVAQDYPDHEQVQSLRNFMLKKLKWDTLRARRRKHYSSAEKWLKIWMELVPENLEPKTLLAKVFVNQGKRALKRRRYKAAVKHANAALEVMPESPSNAFELLGDIDSRRKEYAEALKHYEAALKVPDVGKRQVRRLSRKIKRTRKRVK